MDLRGELTQDGFANLKFDLLYRNAVLFRIT